jgi:hypothetical protein
MRLLALLPPVLVLAASLAFAAPAAAMTFERVTDAPGCESRACIVAMGEIEADTARQFARLLRQEKPAAGAVVILDSEGGDLLQGLALGGEIRKAGLSTRVQRYDRAARAFADGGVCASACAYAFLGGVTRSVDGRARS